MEPTTKEYFVNPNLIDGYIKKVIKRQWIVFGIIFLVVGFFEYIVVLQLDLDLPWWLFACTTLIVFGAFAINIQLRVPTLKKFANNTYQINSNTISQLLNTEDIKELHFEDIAIVHKTYAGLLLIKGNGWTKLDYLRPKRNSTAYDPDSKNAIFIPSITTDFNTLADILKKSAINAFKF